MREEDYRHLDDDEETDEVQVDHSPKNLPIESEQEPIYKEDGYTLPFGVIEEEVHEKFNALIHNIARQETALARDVAYFGTSDLDHILECYNITHAQLEAKLKEPRFSGMVEKFALEIGEDYDGLMRVRAKAYLETMGLTRLQKVINDPRTKDENVIKAVTLMSQLGGAMPKGGNDGTGTSIVFNFGQNNPCVRPTLVLEHEN